MPSFEELSPDEQRKVLVRNAAMEKLLANPETSKKAKRLLREADPTMRFPELEVEDLVDERTAKQQEKVDALEAQMIQRSAESERAKKHQIAIDKGLDPKDVEAAIVDRKIGDWDTAMQFVQMTKQTAPVTPDSASGRFEIMDGKSDWWKDPTKTARTEAFKAIDELRGRRRA